MAIIVESDDWGPGPDVLAEEVLVLVARILEESPIIVEHRFYRGARSPDRHVFDDIDELRGYLAAHARPGDAVWMWRFDELCRTENSLARGKVPDERGRVPRGGAY